MQRPLEGLTVLEFSQFLSGPYAGLRLSDLGARVIKIERPEVGDLCRTLYISDTDLEGDSTLFHAINRNKESFSANLKDTDDLELVKKLIAKADIITQNFRPGVIEKIGLDYESVKKLILKLFMDQYLVMDLKVPGRIYRVKIYWLNQELVLYG